MNKKVKIILWILLGLVVIVGILVALNLATFTSFKTDTSTQVETNNTVEYGPESWKDMIAEDCQTFFDGCNTCNRMENGEVACTTMYCENYEEPKCLDDENGVKNNEDVPECDPEDPLSQCALNEDDFNPEMNGEEIPMNPITFLPREEAIEIVKKEGLTKIYQSHDLNVQFTTSNGEEYGTQEPKLDAYHQLIDACDPACEDVEVITE